jgi:butyrate kinase
VCPPTAGRCCACSSLDSFTEFYRGSGLGPVAAGLYIVVENSTVRHLSLAYMSLPRGDLTALVHAQATTTTVSVAPTSTVNPSTLPQFTPTASVTGVTSHDTSHRSAAGHLVAASGLAVAVILALGAVAVLL